MEFRSVISCLFKASLLILLLQPAITGVGAQSPRSETQGSHTLNSAEVATIAWDTVFLECLEEELEDDGCSGATAPNGALPLYFCPKSIALLPVQFWTRLHGAADSTSARSPPV
jgi:hypothetical protein